MSWAGSAVLVVTSKYLRHPGLVCLLIGTLLPQRTREGRKEGAIVRADVAHGSAHP